MDYNRCDIDFERTFEQYDLIMEYLETHEPDSEEKYAEFIGFYDSFIFDLALTEIDKLKYCLAIETANRIARAVEMQKAQNLIDQLIQNLKTATSNQTSTKVENKHSAKKIKNSIFSLFKGKQK